MTPWSEEGLGARGEGVRSDFLAGLSPAPRRRRWLWRREKDVAGKTRCLFARSNFSKHHLAPGSCSGDGANVAFRCTQTVLEAGGRGGGEAANRTRQQVTWERVVEERVRAYWVQLQEAVWSSSYRRVLAGGVAPFRTGLVSDWGGRGGSTHLPCISPNLLVGRISGRL